VCSHVVLNVVQSGNDYRNLSVVALSVSNSFLRTIGIDFSGSGIDGILGDTSAKEERCNGDVKDTFLRDWDSNDCVLDVGLGDVSDFSHGVDDGFTPFILRVFAVAYEVESVRDDIVVGIG